MHLRCSDGSLQATAGAPLPPPSSLRTACASNWPFINNPVCTLFESIVGVDCPGVPLIRQTSFLPQQPWAGQRCLYDVG